METGGAHESHQLVAQRDSLGQVHTHGTACVLTQSMHSDCLSRCSRISRSLVRLLSRVPKCHWDKVAERRTTSTFAMCRTSGIRAEIEVLTQAA